MRVCYAAGVAVWVPRVWFNKVGLLVWGFQVWGVAKKTPCKVSLCGGIQVMKVALVGNCYQIMAY